MTTVLATILVIAFVVAVDYMALGGPRAGPVAMWRRRLAFIVEAGTLAIAYFSLTTTLFFVFFDADVMAGTIANIVVIVVVVAWDHLVHLLRNRIYRKMHNQEFRRRWFYAAWWLTGASWKSALYVFYIGLLIGTALLAAQPDFEVEPNVAAYLDSVRYGLLVLVASDKFADQMVKELSREDKLRMVAAETAEK